MSAVMRRAGVPATCVLSWCGIARDMENRTSVAVETTQCRGIPYSLPVPPRPIALVRASGTHRQVGLQIGAATAASVRRQAQAVDARRLAQAAGYREATAAELPWLVEELDAVAEGAGADPMAVFASTDRGAVGRAGRSRVALLRPRRVPAGDRRRPRLGRAQQRPRPRGRGRPRRDRVARARRPGRVHDRRRARDQRRVQLRRARADGERALAERRSRRHPAAAARARHPAPAHPRGRGRGGAAPAAGVVLQQPAVPPRRRRLQRRGLGDRRRAAPA